MKQLWICDINCTNRLYRVHWNKWIAARYSPACVPLHLQQRPGWSIVSWICKIYRVIARSPENMSNWMACSNIGLEHLININQSNRWSHAYCSRKKHTFDKRSASWLTKWWTPHDSCLIVLINPTVVLFEKNLCRVSTDYNWKQHIWSKPTLMKQGPSTRKSGIPCGIDVV